VFPISLASPVNISNGVPAAGAGNLETAASQDHYRFTLTAGQSVLVNVLSCPDTFYLAWALVSETTGATVSSASLCTPQEVDNLAAGNYRLQVSPDSRHAGTYAMQVLLVPPPQVFSVSLASPVNISNGVPAAGAGNLETVASQDRYKFTATAGQSVTVTPQTCPGTFYLDWALVAEATGATVASAQLCSSRQVDHLAAGAYRLVVSPGSQHSGTYTLRLADPAHP
jgi:hypothetical protein